MNSSKHPTGSGRWIGDGKGNLAPAVSCKTTVLVICNEPQVRQSLRRSLEDSGYLVVDDSSGLSLDEGGRAPVGTLPAGELSGGFADASAEVVSVAGVPGPPFSYPRPHDPWPVANHRFEWGPLAIDFDDCLVTVAGNRVRLTATEYSLLRILAERSGKLVTYREIVRRIWGRNNDKNRRCLRVYACSLRKKLRKLACCELVLTEPVVGYRLAAV